MKDTTRTRKMREAPRKPYSFFLDADLVEKAVSNWRAGVIRSIERRWPRHRLQVVVRKSQRERDILS